MPTRMSQFLAALFIATLCAMLPVCLSAQSSNEDPCKNARLQQLWDGGSDPVYTDATEMGRTLSERGFVVECIHSSVEQHRFEGEKGAAWFKTDHGTFDVLFLPKGQSYDSLEVIEQPQQSGRYVYSFRGTPRIGSEDSSKQMWFIKHGNALFSVWGDKQLAASLEQALQKP